MRRFGSHLVLAAVAAWTPPAAASDHRVSITWSPVHLVFPFVELSGEAKIVDTLGASMIAGFGVLRSNDESFRAYDIGAQLRWYPIGSFEHGMQVGGEVLYTGVEGEDSSITGEGIGGGAFVGYKLILEIGFTVEAQLGLSYVALGGGDETTRVEARAIFLLANLNVGWSF